MLIETICININTCNKPGNTKVSSITFKQELSQKQKYIFDKKLPYWIIYRNEEFDNLFNKMNFDIFLKTEFEGGRHERRICELDEMGV